MALLSLLVLASVICLVTLQVYVGTRNRKKPPTGLKPLPGPKGYPFIGSVPDVPEKNSFIKFSDWGKVFGPIYQTNLAGHNHVWISRDGIARDLLAKKGAIYSDRPHIPALIDDNRTSAQYLPLMSKNDGWTRQRKFANHIMRESEKAVFNRYPELEAKRLLVELMNEPSQYNHALESYISRVTCRLAWGHSEASDELKQRARELLVGVSPTGALGNKLPFLMTLPDFLSPAKAWERRRAKTERCFFETMQGHVQADMAEKRAPLSWMRTYLEDRRKWGSTYDLEGAYMVGMHGIAGALTIAAPMQSFCLAMCYYSQYLPKLHEEIDRVCGDRPPRSEDRPYLPFLRAVIRECIRWRPPVPTGIPHYLTEDDEYEGYHIPKGSTIHPLEWAIARDPELYPDPEAFNPLRWLDPSYPTYQEPLTQYPTIINCTQFGYGRRVCQGQTVADEDLLIGIGSVAWLFNIIKTTGDTAQCGLDKNDNEMKQKKKMFTNSDIGEPLLTNEKVLSLNEEPNIGLSPSLLLLSMPEEEILLRTSSSPGAWPQQDPEEILLAAHTAASQQEEKKKKKEDSQVSQGKPKSDPTLDFTTLLIAKPLPFEFTLQIRNEGRARIIKAAFEEERARGEFVESQKFWGEDQGRNKPLGWSKV